MCGESFKNAEGHISECGGAVLPAIYLCRHCLRRRIQRFCPAIEWMDEGRVVLRLQLLDQDRVPHQACIAVTVAELGALFSDDRQGDFVNIVAYGEVLSLDAGNVLAVVH